MTRANLTTFEIDNKFQQEDRIFISKDLCQQWKLTEKDRITLRFGTKLAFATLTSQPNLSRSVAVSTTITNQLYLPTPLVDITLTFDEQQRQIIIGPIISLLTEIVEQESKPNFQSVHSFCEELHVCTKDKGAFFYVFSLKDVKNDYIDGFLFTEGSWRKTAVPFPDVIHNRIHSRLTEKKKLFQQFILNLDSKNIPIFNTRFLSKMDVHKILLQENYLNPYIPKTDWFSKDKLTEYLEQFKVIYMKPINGSKGKNILRIERREDHYYVFDTNSQYESIQVFLNTEMLIPYLVKRIGKKPFLLQEGIAFIHLKNRPLDFRILCHRDEQQIWKITSVVARLSAENKFVANLAQGGELLKPLIALRKFYDKRNAYAYLAHMKELCIEIATVISQAIDGYFGEFGIDVSIDDSGKIWIIEVNSKPSKNMEVAHKKIRPSAKAIIDYAYILACNK